MNFKELIKVDRKAKTPLYLQIANEITEAIQKGILSGGHKLPGTQRMANELNVFKKTIEQSYAELEIQGWVISKPYSGTYVSAKLPILRTAQNIVISDKFPSKALFNFKYLDFKNTIDSYFTKMPSAKIVFDDGYPDISQMAAIELDKNYRALLEKKKPSSIVNRMSPWGNNNLRNYLCDYVNQTRGLRATKENLMIVKGNQFGMFLILSLLLDSSVGFAIAETNYKGIDDIAKYLNSTTYYIKEDREGMDMEDLEKTCIQQKISVVYIMSHNHYPSTRKLSFERRDQLLNLARLYNFVIIEDDHDFDYHFDNAPSLPIASIDNSGRVIYIGGLNRCISSALRISFIVGPTDFLQELVKLKTIIDKFTDPLLEEALSGLIKGKDFLRFLRKSTNFYRIRRDYMCKLIKEKLSDYCTVDIPEAGLAIWLEFDRKVDVQLLTNKCLSMGLSLPHAEELYIQPASSNGLRIGYSTLTTDEIFNGIIIMQKVLADIC